MKKYEDYDYAISQNDCGGHYLNTKNEVDSDGKKYRIVNGSVLTEWGFVRVLTPWSNFAENYPCIQFVRNGRLYTRKFKKSYSAQFLVTKAKEFAEELSHK